MENKITLEEKLDRINEFFNNLSDDDFERMALEAGLGEIKDSDACSYVLATSKIAGEKYVNEQKMLNETDNNQFFYRNDRRLRGAA